MIQIVITVLIYKSKKDLIANNITNRITSTKITKETKTNQHSK